jgi:hypothetical protein
MNRFPHVRHVAATRITQTTRAVAVSLAIVGTLGALPAVAQQVEAPTVVFERWLRVLEVVPVPPQPATIVAITPPAQLPAPATPFEPLPVILGEPELPLVGGPSPGASAAWDANLNYQGMQVAYLVSDATGSRLEQRPLSSPPRRGERFKIRVTPTFDAQVRVAVLTGGAWSPSRGPNLVPASTGSVRVAAGRTMDLPAERDHYFMIGEAGVPRLLLSVHHERADEANRTRQPAYRRDLAGGTTYMQLVPVGSRPAIEQMITAAP